ncbi:MAG: 16S rRNA (cytosine(1402)-N(4))-methyltransferase RsmH [bacterium]|nr:16S rRNA (cytosine(1402)-N(4))-methyltransferase RsmH [bacterium]
MIHDKPQIHFPVLVDEVLKYLDPKPNGVYLDATLGLGGHALEISKRIGSGGTIIGIDCDPTALEIAKKRLQAVSSKVIFVHGNFRNLTQILSQQGFSHVDGMLFDLGMSSLQLNDPKRGFSFQQSGPLDMRFDTSNRMTAADWLNSVTESALEKIIQEYGEERYAGRIARAIVQSRSIKPIRTTDQLSKIISAAVSRSSRYRRNKIHPATRTFQAIRIYVNQELANLEAALAQFIDCLSLHGRAVFISFHSLEDRRVKIQFKLLKGECVCGGQGLEGCSCPRVNRVRVLTKKPVRASAQELAFNPRARSARLRAVERIA